MRKRNLRIAKKVLKDGIFRSKKRCLGKLEGRQKKGKKIFCKNQLD